MDFLLLNQTFHPDVMATGQYLTELALGLVERGHKVTVLTSRRAYDHPETRFPRKETWSGIRIIRVGSTGFGKGARWKRAADFASFSAACALRLALLPRHDAVVALTSPPLISFLGAWVAKLRRSRFYYWVMDFNPDEAIAAGWLPPKSIAARLLEKMSRFSLRRATRIIALDRFMRDRILAKDIPPEKVVVLPPWSHDTDVAFDAPGREKFRKAHGLTGKFVVMYSGNHSPCHPLDTLVRAAEELRDERDIHFCFVGGGSEWRKIQARLNTPPAASPDDNPAFQPPRANILCLPYQPLTQLSGSLSAADLHVVVMGNPFVGLVHPCKIYNILRVEAPVLYIGPRRSHVMEIFEPGGDDDSVPPERSPRTSASPDRSPLHGWAPHGDVQAVVDQILRLRQESRRCKTGAATLAIQRQFSKDTLLPKLIHELEHA